MSEWNTMVRLFDAMRGMAGSMIEDFPSEEFDRPRGDANSAKWIAGHLALGMDFGLNILGRPTEEIGKLMPTYGPGSPGGAIGDDGRTQQSLVDHFRSTGDQLKEAVLAASDEQLKRPNETPFLAEELPTAGDLLAHVFTTHIAMHMGQLSQMRREMGMKSFYDFG